MDSREEFLREKIEEKFTSIRKFAEHVKIPSTTITGGLAKGIGGMALDTVLKICAALDVDINTLNPYINTQESKSFVVSGKDDVKVIKKFTSLSPQNKNKVEGMIDMYAIEQQAEKRARDTEFANELA